MKPFEAGGLLPVIPPAAGMALVMTDLYPYFTRLPVPRELSRAPFALVEDSPHLPHFQMENLAFFFKMAGKENTT